MMNWLQFTGTGPMGLVTLRPDGTAQVRQENGIVNELCMIPTQHQSKGSKS